MTTHLKLDLSLAVPFHAACSLADALNPGLGERTRAQAYAPVLPLSFDDLTKVWYGLESLGATDRSKAASLVQGLLTALREHPGLHIEPWSDSPLSEDSLAVLWYLMTSPGLPLTFELSGLPTHARDILESWSPGDEPDDLSGRLRAPWRPAVEGASRDSGAFLSWLRAGGWPLLGGEEPNHDDRLRLAWEVLRTGATDLAVQLFKAESLLSDKAQEVMEGVLLGLQRFSDLEAATEQAPSSSPHRSFVQAYAKLLLRKDEQAVRHLEDAGLTDPERARGAQDIYRLNALSLLAFRAGDKTQARAIQDRMRSYSISHPHWYSTNIAYTNELNLGRLARSSGRNDDALRHFQAAFGQLDGINLLPDLLYAAVLEADLRRASGEHKAAALSWFRASLIWSALPCRNSVHWRLASSLLRRSFEMDSVPTSSSLAQVFVRHLEQAIAEGSLPAVPSAPPLLTSALRSRRSPEDSRYIFTAGVAGVVTQVSGEPSDRYAATQAGQTLSQLCARVLVALCPELSSQAPLHLHLDTDDGVGFPRTAEQAALRERLLSEGPLPPTQVRVHPAIERLITKEGWWVRYKRGLTPRRLNLLELLVLEELSAAGGQLPQQSLQERFSELDPSRLDALAQARLLHRVSGLGLEQVG